MNQSRVSCRCIVLFIAVLVSLTAQAQPARQVLPQRTHPLISRLAPVGRVPQANRLNLAVGLPLRNQLQLDEFIQSVSDPASPNYRRYLAPEEFAKRFGPTEQDYQAVENFFRTNGFTVASEHPNRVVLDVSGSTADIERVFHVNLRTYQHPSEGRAFFAPDTEPSIDLAVPVLHVAGLTDLPRPRSKMILRPAAGATVASKGANGSGSGPVGNYVGNDFRATYAPGVSLAGAGQTVALVQFDGYYLKDITNYENLIGIAPGNYVTLTNVLLDGFTGNPISLKSTFSGNVEVSLDIEMVISMAPGLSKIILYEGNPTNFFPDDVLNRIATDNAASQVSSSWGWSGGPSPIVEQIFKQMAAQGQTYFNASGDSDAFVNNAVDDPTLVNQPSGSTNIVQVGGTTLMATNPVSETVWNWGGGVGSSGGISPSNAIPYWQTNVSMAANHGSTTRRNLPDVALTADNVFVKYGNGLNATNIGGTSVAAPLWAGFTALVNQRAAQAGQAPVGFINPAVYAIGTGGSYGADFNDVTSGDNYWSSSPTDYPAVVGFDLCTGWGTPRAGLIDALAVLDALGVSPGTGFDAVGPVGGPFNVGSQNFTLTNATGTSLDWSLLGVPSWIDVSCSGGTLAADGGVAVAASLNSAASNLLAGIYAADLIFSNSTSHFTQSRHFTLAVGQPLVRNGGFESGDFSYWTMSGSSSVNFADNGSATGITPHSGAYSMVLGQPKAFAYLSQTMVTIPGQRYALSFWWRNPTAGSGQQFAVSWNTNSSGTNIIYNSSSPGAFGWTNLLFIVTATSSSTVLRFAARNDPVYFGLDDVMVSTNLALADRGRPTNWITVPVANQRWSNIVCVVTGRANDNVGVANVFYSLNNGSWTSAATGDHWTNWSATLTLTPGTNKVQSYAVDFAGNVSTTNAVKFVCSLMTPLTVVTNGGGTITPVYNGVLLQVSNAYAMTAKVGAGFRFVNWTDGSDQVMTNGVTLKFVMASNLLFSANFADIKKPTNGIVAPKANQRWSNNVFMVTGKAGDNVGVSNVFYSLNDGAWTVATTASHWTNWSVAVDLVPGTNKVQAYAMDFAGNVSTTNTVKLIHVIVDWAPASLNGMLGTLTRPGQSAVYLGCWTNTFSQYSTDTNSDNAVGAYTYTKLSTNTARLSVTYTFPSIFTNDGASLFLTFTTNNGCTFSNELNSSDLGAIFFSPRTRLLPASLSGLKTLLLNAAGNPTYLSLGSGTVTITNSDGVVQAAAYTSKPYSPMGTLLKIVQSAKTNYLQLTFLATNYGAYFFTFYDNSGNETNIDCGVFGLLLKASSPVSVSGTSAQVWDAGVMSYLSFSNTTFSAISTDTNEDNAVGNYNYTRTGTNTAQLDIAFTAPPDTTNDSDSRLLRFISPNFCVFTNQDSSGSNYLAGISFAPENNLLPASLAGRTITATTLDGIVDVIAFNGDGTFSQDETGSGNPGVSTGTYTFTPYSPEGAMLQLNFTNGVAANMTSYLEAVFAGNVPGMFFVTDFDNSPALTGMDFGTFIAQ